MPARKSFMAEAKRSSDREAQREAVGTLFNSAGDLATGQFASRPTRAQDLPLARIRPNPFQARRTFANLDELAQAIRVQGFTSRLRVRPSPTEPSFFQLVYGERRLRAAELAGLAVVPCDIVEHSDAEMIEIGLAENIQRLDLDPLEEAMSFRQMIDQRGYSIRSLAERIGKDKGYIENRLVLLNTPADIQQMIAQRPDSVRAAREIAKLDTPEQRQPLIAGIVTGQLTDRTVRAQVRELQAAQPGTTTPNAARASATQRAPAIDHDLRTIQTIVQRWQAAHDQGQLPADQLAQALQTLQDMATAAQPRRTRKAGNKRT